MASLEDLDHLGVVTPEKMASHVPPEVEYLKLSDRTLAYRQLKGRGPIIVYVGGLLSTMEIYKATVLEQYAKRTGRASIRYDQSSCGLSKGVERQDATIEVWIKDCLAILGNVANGQPVILVASSQGGWISVHAAKVRPRQIKGLVLIGPGYSYPHIRFDTAIENGWIPDDIMEKLNNGESIKYPTPYGDTYFGYKHVEASRRYAIDTTKDIPLDCPVRILHALQDEDVPWKSSLNLLEKVTNLDSDLVIRKRGNHRLMRPADLTLLVYTVDSLLITIEDVGQKANL